MLSTSILNNESYRRPPGDSRQKAIPAPGCAKIFWQCLFGCHPERSRGVSPWSLPLGCSQGEIPRLASLARNDSLFCLPENLGAPPLPCHGAVTGRRIRICLGRDLADTWERAGSPSVAPVLGWPHGRAGVEAIRPETGDGGKSWRLPAMPARPVRIPAPPRRSGAGGASTSHNVCGGLVVRAPSPAHRS